MKIKDNFMLRQIADTHVVLPVDTDMLDFNGMITLNETGCMLWKMLECECEAKELVDALLDEFEVSSEQATADVEEFLNKLKSIDCLENL